MSKYLALVAALLQGLVLAYMAAEREWVLRTGRVVYLRTAPLDPRDVMRGDYVRLDYEVSRVPRTSWRDGLAVSDDASPAVPRDTKVYAVLRETEDGLAELVSLSDLRPADGLFLRGRANPWWRGNLIGVRYGIEGYFLEQGRAKDLELQRSRGGVQIPLEMAVAIGGNGLAVIKDHRWSAVGIGLELESRPQTSEAGAGPPGGLVSAKVHLLNASEDDVAIVDLPGGRALALVPDQRFNDDSWDWARRSAPVPDAKPEDVVVLRPGQIHTIPIDFQDPAWFIVDLNKPGEAAVSLARTEANRLWGAVFRFEYRPPDRRACQQLPHASLIWHGRLLSRGFGPTGRVD